MEYTAVIVVAILLCISFGRFSYECDESIRRMMNHPEAPKRKEADDGNDTK